MNVRSVRQCWLLKVFALMNPKRNKRVDNTRGVILKRWIDEGWRLGGMVR